MLSAEENGEKGNERNQLKNSTNGLNLLCNVTARQVHTLINLTNELTSNFIDMT